MSSFSLIAFIVMSTVIKGTKKKSNLYPLDGSKAQTRLLFLFLTFSLSISSGEGEGASVTDDALQPQHVSSGPLLLP